MDGSVAVAGEMNKVVAIYKFSSVFVFEIACFSTSTGFSWDHHGIFATLSSRLVKKFRDISIILCQPGHKRDVGLNSRTVPAKPGHLATMLLYSGSKEC